MRISKCIKIFLGVLLVNSAIFSFALEPVKTGDPLKDSATLANRRTALRCLSLANNYLSEQNYNAAISQIQLGLAYDENISDLWYVLSWAGYCSGASKADVLSNVEKSLAVNKWVEYNRDSARILYADILSDTLRYNEVLQIVDGTPMIYSSDAEYIRAKTYYRLGDKASVEKARSRIDVARRIYTDDTRFPLLFFKYENPEDNDAKVRKIADFFVNEIHQYVEASPDKDAELEIYAALFARGEHKKHLLRSFSARELRHPLYAIVALQAELIDEKTSFEYFTTFADDSIQLDFINQELKLLTDENVLASAKEYFTAYSGTILQDTNGDGISDLTVKYNRGRPETLVYDKNQDGKTEWDMICDFGVPVSSHVYSNDFSVTWKYYPSLETVKFPYQRYFLVNESYKWSPVNISNKNEITQITGFQFFYPELGAGIEELSTDKLLDASSYFEIDCQERKDTVVRFILDNGNIKSALYFKENKLFAQSQFENNLPVLRIVDADGDGVYETSEFYDLDADNSMEVHSLEDERNIMTNLFGVPSNGVQFYLRLVQIDLDKDTVPDFTEEYIAHGGKISSWDINHDGKWNVRYVKYPAEKGNDVVKEESMFYVNPGKKLVTVCLENGIPVNVSYNESSYKISKDSSCDFYWIGSLDDSLPESYYNILAKNALYELSKVQIAQSILLNQDAFSVLCITIGNGSYGFIIPKVE